jgi:hypothetical protein
MFRASMPEAPIEEHRDSLSGEDNVRAHRPAGGGGETKVLAESKTAGVELGSQAALGRRVGAPVGLHRPLRAETARAGRRSAHAADG